MKTEQNEWVFFLSCEVLGLFDPEQDGPLFKLDAYARQDEVGHRVCTYIVDLKKSKELHTARGLKPVAESAFFDLAAKLRRPAWMGEPYASLLEVQQFVEATVDSVVSDRFDDVHWRDVVTLTEEWPGVLIHVASGQRPPGWPPDKKAGGDQ